MLRFINYLLIAHGFILPVIIKIENGFLMFLANIALLLCVAVFLEAIDYEENIFIFSFMVMLPFILYITGLPTANANLGMFLGTVFLAVSLPLVFMFLVAQLLIPVED